MSLRDRLTSEDEDEREVEEGCSFKTKVSDPFQRERKCDLVRSLPVIFDILLSTYLYVIFVVFHVLPMLQFHEPSTKFNRHAYRKGLTELSFFHVFFLLLSFCFVRVIVTPAGSIPDAEVWLNRTGGAELPVRERKRDGRLRFCKWCLRYKPDRTHHCRQCGKCILKMDHHCPWIYNCVGWGNHKYFLLTLVYTVLTSGFVVVCQLESVLASITDTQMYFPTMFLLWFGEALAGLVTFVCGSFLLFHLWLVSNNLSTIEFCEKHFRKGPGKNIYNKGVFINICDAFGKNPLLWFFPIDNRRGDGISFNVNEEVLKLVSGKNDA